MDIDGFNSSPSPSAPCSGASRTRPCWPRTPAARGLRSGGKVWMNWRKMGQPWENWGACSLRSLRLAYPRLGAPLCSAWTISGKIHAMFVTGPSTGVQDWPSWARMDWCSWKHFWKPQNISSKPSWANGLAKYVQLHLWSFTYSYQERQPLQE